MEWPASFLNGPVICYLALIAAVQVVPPMVIQAYDRRVDKHRKKVGLAAPAIIGHAKRLSRERWEASLQAGCLLAAVFGVPVVILGLDVAGWVSLEPSVQGGLASVFVVIIAWLLLQGTDVAKAFLGGLAFKTLVAFRYPIQVGDRVTLKGHAGRVTKLGTFFVTLVTVDDDMISIPTRELWSDVLVSANAGARSSLCVVSFYLSPSATKCQRQKAEDAVWDAIQISPYWETSKPMQIYLSQTPEAICLTAKAYVTSTYDEPLFKSDITRAFLDTVDDIQIPLGVGRRRLSDRK